MRCDEKFARLLPPDYLSSLESHPHAVYGLWPDLSLAYVNAQWFAFAEENGGATVRRDWPVGRSMLDAVPEVARDWYKTFYESALDTDRANPNVHEYECLSPERYRKYVMTVHSLASGLHKGLIAVHSLLAEAPIEATSYTPLPAVRELYTQPDGLIRQCMHCRRVNRAYEARVWDWVPDWVREPQENVTHALCDPCLAHFYSRDDVGSA